MTSLGQIAMTATSVLPRTSPEESPNPFALTVLKASIRPQLATVAQAVLRALVIVHLPIHRMRVLDVLKENITILTQPPSQRYPLTMASTCLRDRKSVV